MGRHQDALADSESAVKCDPTFVKGYLRRAAANEALKNWEDAVRDYEKVTPSWCPTFLHVLDVCLKPPSKPFHCLEGTGILGDALTLSRSVAYLANQ